MPYSNSEKSDATLNLSDLKVLEEKQKELRERYSFEECQKIKRAGELYRENPLKNVAQELKASEDEIEELVAKYLVLVTEPSDSATLLATNFGIKYFGGQKTLKEVIVASSYGEEKVKEYIREFTGSTLKNKDLNAVNLDREIPEKPIKPTSLEEITQELQKLPQLNLPPVTLKSLTNGFAIPQKDYSLLLGSINVSDMLPKISPTEEIQDMFQEQQKTFQRLFKVGNILEESFKPIRESIQGLYKHFEKVQEAVEEGISNFDKPEDYDPNEIDVNSLAKKTGKDWALEFAVELDNAEVKELKPYLDRIALGLEQYDNKNPELPIFLFTSMQDGLMHWLCEKDSDTSPDRIKNDSEIFYSDTKRDVLRKKYQGFFGLETGHFIGNLESFYDHRNAIMHGDPISYYDINLATVSLLFFDLTLYTVLREAGHFTE